MRTEDRGLRMRTEDRGPKTEDQGPKTKDRRLRTEYQRQRIEDRGQGISYNCWGTGMLSTCLDRHINKLRAAAWLGDGDPGCLG